MRAVLRNVDFDLAVRFPGQVELIQASVPPCHYYRVRDVDGSERAWVGGPAWHYCLSERDGQKELRRAFEGLFNGPAGE